MIIEEKKKTPPYIRLPYISKEAVSLPVIILKSFTANYERKLILYKIYK